MTQRVSLPPVFQAWFEARNWQPRAHQLEVLHAAAAGKNTLLIAPTGGGKTLAGFLPSLVDLAKGAGGQGIHTIYVSPLKALAVDIARNLEAPVAEMKLPVTIETRTGDTPASRRIRQRAKPPDILITTPEQIALLIADPHAAHLFGNLRFLILDELHSLVASKRGALLALGLARLSTLSPALVRIGLSATIAKPETLACWMVPQPGAAQIVIGKAGAAPDITILRSLERVPWSGHSARYATAEIYEAIKQSRMALIFVNTRSQAEIIFQQLWNANEDALPIALHHGALADAAGQRRTADQSERWHWQCKVWRRHYGQRRRCEPQHYPHAATAIRFNNGDDPQRYRRAISVGDWRAIPRQSDDALYQ